jgi:hypothetical protein
MNDRRALIEQWEEIAMDAIKTKGLSRSELDAIHIGLRQSKNQQLVDIITEMRDKAWKAKLK